MRYTIIAELGIWDNKIVTKYRIFDTITKQKGLAWYTSEAAASDMMLRKVSR